MQAESFCRICEEDEPHRLLLLIAISKGSGTQRKFMRETNPIGVLLLIAISKGRVSAESFCRIEEPHRGSAFDSPGLPNDSAGYPGLAYGLWRTTP